MKTKKGWFALAYVLATAVWILGGFWTLAKGVYYEHKGMRVHQTLSWQELEPVSIKRLDSQEPGIWYVSTDTDPQLHWTGNIYLEQVDLKIQHTTPGLSVVLYWREPGQADFSEQQSVYAVQTADGMYRFDLGGKRVEEIRIDPDSVGGVITRFDGVVLNPQTSWYEAFLPTTTGVMLFLILPLLAVALAQEIKAMLCFIRERKRG